MKTCYHPHMKNEDSISVRLRRYGQVTSAVGSVAARLVGQKFLGIEIDRSAHAEGLTAVLGTLKGPLMKVAQFLATIPGALPPEYANMFLSLQMNAPSMGWAFVRRRMSSELGSNWQSHFSEFSEVAAAAASLGQVHQAKSNEGHLLACKLQYPNMDSILQADLDQFKLMLSLYESWSKALDTDEVREEIAQRLEEELDYHHEAQNIQLYHHIFEQGKNHTTLGHEIKSVNIPHVFTNLSTRRLLTLSWMEGSSLLNMTEAPLEKRNAIGRQLFMAWYYPFYHYGIIHGDPHPGNYTVCPKGGLNILDFGCVRIFPATFIQGVIDLYRSLQRNDRDLAVHAYTSWGFKNLTNETIDVINQWAKLL